MRGIPLIWIFCGGLAVACSADYTPKPKAYFRIDLPPKEYQRFEREGYPFTYEYPVYATVTDFDDPNEKAWANVNFPSFQAKINLSYKRVDNNLKELVADATRFVGKHEQKATGIFEKEYSYPEGSVYGVVYNIKGPTVASTYQFYLTDSVRHFVRGAFYFDFAANNDSLAPVIEFLKADIDNLIQTLNWK